MSIDVDVTIELPYRDVPVIGRDSGGVSNLGRGPGAGQGVVTPTVHIDDVTTVIDHVQTVVGGCLTPGRVPGINHFLVTCP